MSSRPIVVIGAGHWGKNHVRVFYELGVLAAVCETDAERRKQLQVQYPGVTIYADIAKALAHPGIEGVSIATPSESHFEVGLMALKSGKHVLMEKPLCLDVKEAEALVHFAEAAGKTLMVGHVLHYHPAVIRMKELIGAGEIGKLNYFYTNRLNLGKFRTEENILWSFAPHDISLMLDLIKEYPEHVFCMGGSYLSKHIADVTICTFSFASGVRSHIFVSWLHPTKEQKVIIVGSQGMLVFDDGAEPEHKLALYRHKILWKNGQPVPSKNAVELIKLQWEEPLKIECRTFLKAMETGASMITDGQEGLRTLRLLNDCQKSLSSGKPLQTPSSSSLPLDIYVHPSASIDSHVSIGSKSKVWHFTHVSEGAKIGKSCSLGQNVFIGRQVRIGNNVKIQNNVSIYEKVEVEDNVFLGPSMVFTNVINPRSEITRKHEYRKTVVKQGATIGANATIVCGHTIGEYAFVGAGAIVTRDIPPHALAYGSPAKIQGWACRCGEKLARQPKNRWQCQVCRRLYQGSTPNNAQGLRELPAPPSRSPKQKLLKR